MNEQWVVAAKRADFRAIADEFGIDPVIARLIRNRDVMGSEAIRAYLRGGLSDLHDPALLPDMNRACETVLRAIDADDPIRIIGDYDIDGVMSSYILLIGLSRLGARADVRIPERIRDGYGLNESLVRNAAADGISLIVTCDNGIAAAEQIAVAKELGLTVVVTDHHEVPVRDEDGVRHEALPAADAVVDPKRADCEYPFRELCGAGVAWKLICHLYALRGIPQSEAEELLEFVAIATIGDIVDLTGENRILVKEGLVRLHRTENPGLVELISQCGLSREQIDVYHVGFILGPCLNASGRLDTAQRALDLLCADDRGRAAVLAGDLVALNASRKDMTERGKEEAIRIVESTGLTCDRVLVVFLPDCHESLAGIIAGRLREIYGRPAFVLTRTADGVKGSGRSIEAYSMFEELSRCDDLLTRYGGHRQAAGLSMPEENVEAFRQRINELCTLAEEDMAEKVVIDVAVPISYVSEDLVRQMDLLRPYGKGNPKPLFADRDLRVENLRIFGANRNVARMQLAGKDGARVPAVYFGDADAFAEYVSSRETISAAYVPAIDTFRGNHGLQLTVEHYR